MIVNAEVKAIDEDIAMWSQDKDAATEVREKEHADYMETCAAQADAIFTSLSGWRIQARRASTYLKLFLLFGFDFLIFIPFCPKFTFLTFPV